MKYLSLLMVLAIVYAVYTHMGSVAPSKTAISESVEAGTIPSNDAPGAPAAPPANSIKAPLDRTHAVLDQVRKQNSGN